MRRNGVRWSLSSCQIASGIPCIRQEAEPLVPDHHVLDADAVAGDHGFGSAGPVDDLDVPPTGVGIGPVGAAWPIVTLPIGVK
jgi:hypothetical protein